MCSVISDKNLRISDELMKIFDENSKTLMEILNMFDENWKNFGYLGI